jgi:hypothetical protein
MQVRPQLWPTLVSAKFLVLFAVILGFFAEFNTAQFQNAYAHWPPGTKATLSSRFSTWDAAHYIQLSSDGYEKDSPSCAFYPLWPAFIHVAGTVMRSSPVMASMLLANVLSLVGLLLFYDLVKRHCGESISKDSVILMLAFPGALFFSFPYTESLYLVILMAFFWAIESRHWVWAACSGFFLPLARPIGVFIILPLAWFLYEHYQPSISKWSSQWKSFRSNGFASLSWNQLVPFAPLILLLFPLAGYAAYFVLMYVWTGNAFEGFGAQKHFPYSPSIRNMFDYGQFWNSFVNIHSLDGMLDSALDRVCFGLFLVLLPLIYRLNKTWFFYVVPAGLIPALTSWFMSYRRYIMVLFPIFIVLAQLLQKSPSRFIFWGYVVALAVLQVLAISQFFNFYWAG